MEPVDLFCEPDDAYDFESLPAARSQEARPAAQGKRAREPLAVLSANSQRGGHPARKVPAHPAPAPAERREAWSGKTSGGGAAKRAPHHAQTQSQQAATAALDAFRAEQKQVAVYLADAAGTPPPRVQPHKPRAGRTSAGDVEARRVRRPVGPDATPSPPPAEVAGVMDAPIALSPAEAEPEARARREPPRSLSRTPRGGDGEGGWQAERQHLMACLGRQMDAAREEAKRARALEGAAEAANERARQADVRRDLLQGDLARVNAEAQDARDASRRHEAQCGTLRGELTALQRVADEAAAQHAAAEDTLAEERAVRDRLLHALQQAHAELAELKGKSAPAAPGPAQHEAACQTPPAADHAAIAGRLQEELRRMAEANAALRAELQLLRDGGALMVSQLEVSKDSAGIQDVSTCTDCTDMLRPAVTPQEDRVVGAPPSRRSGSRSVRRQLRSMVYASREAEAESGGDLALARQLHELRAENEALKAQMASPPSPSPRIPPGGDTPLCLLEVPGKVQAQPVPPPGLESTEELLSVRAALEEESARRATVEATAAALRVELADERRRAQALQDWAAACPTAGGAAPADVRNDIRTSHTVIMDQLHEIMLAVEGASPTTTAASTQQGPGGSGGPAPHTYVSPGCTTTRGGPYADAPSQDAVQCMEASQASLTPRDLFNSRCSDH